MIPHNSTLSIPMGMIDFTPFLEGLEPPDLFSVKMSTASLRSALLPHYSLPVFSPTISRRQWYMFWKEDIPLKARDVWYRLLHNKLPCRSTLHSTLPSFFVDPVCQICSTIAESSTHFVYSCHHKHPIWEYIWDTYIDTPFSQPALHSAIFSLNMPTVKSIYKNTSSFQFLACTLLAIWSSHWSFIFAGSRFALPEVITLIQKHLDTLNPDLID
ncbi:hypothetical protein G6F37_007348 [Rhizopus arrhizus]|nr:hypothetical protein G6F38_007502 [Rhizopus arrhizus]KAG1156718.1 hypothetical protein G6F37_007348 [Rhizopus arrhizus]